MGHDSRAPGGGAPPPDQPLDWVTRPLRIFAAHRLSGAAMLRAATIVALIWADSRRADSYHALLATPPVAKVGILLRSAASALAGLMLVASTTPGKPGHTS